MDAHKLQLKVFLKAPEAFDVARVVPVFHRWIREHALNELLIDVADYGHVPDGPGVLLVGHGADYFLHAGKGRWGLLFSRKREAPEPSLRLRDTFARALRACALLERESELGFEFGTGELLFSINDRLGAPNTDATFSAVRPELEVFLRELYDVDSVELSREGEERELLSVRIKSPRAEAVGTLLSRCGSGPWA
jgi:hypothetical protein